jgi:hypothetical protein
MSVVDVYIIVSLGERAATRISTILLDFCADVCARDVF